MDGIFCKSTSQYEMILGVVNQFIKMGLPGFEMEQNLNCLTSEE